MSKVISAAKGWRPLASAESGATAVEFGLIAGIVIVVSVAIIEFSLAVFDYTRAAEATRAAGRVSVMLPPVGALDNLASGDVVCGDSAGATSCGATAVVNPTTFDQIVATMHDVLPLISAENVEVRYASSGIGSFESGGIKPYVTIRLTNLQRPFLLLDALIGTSATITLPDFATTQIGNVYQPG